MFEQVKKIIIDELALDEDTVITATTSLMGDLEALVLKFQMKMLKVLKTLVILLNT